MTWIGMYRTAAVAVFITAAVACSNDDGGQSQPADNFNRKAMLSFTADEIIIPALSNYVSTAQDFDQAAQNFKNDPSPANLDQLQLDFQLAYLAWQELAVFDIGPAEARTLRNFSNVFPCDTSDLKQAILAANANLSLPSTYDIQGWPAADYLLHGLANDKQAIIAFYQANPDYATYLQSLSARLLSLAQEVLNEWTSSYREAFVNNDGGTATSAFNKLANDYVFHFEKELRAGKIGIPAGVFSGTTFPNRVEAFYSDSLSKALFLHCLNFQEKVFRGVSYDGNSTGPSMQSYLEELGQNGLAQNILDQFNEARQAAQDLNPNLHLQVKNNNILMLQVYDELQVMIPWLKVDMLQAFNVSVDYIDADGD